MAREETKVNRFIRGRIQEARDEAGKSQEVLAEYLSKGRAAVSDIERGRVNVDISDLVIISGALGKPLTYFLPPWTRIQAEDELSPLEQELITEFRSLPDAQRLIALDYVRQQRQMVERALKRAADEDTQTTAIFGGDED